MKKYIFLTTIIGLLFFFSCEKEPGQVLELVKSATPETPTANNFVFSDETAEDTAVVIRWEAAEYDIMTPVSYIVEMDTAGGDFVNGIEMIKTSADSLPVTVFSFNNFMTKSLGMPVGVESEVNIRIGSKTGESAYDYSDPISIFATTYDPPYTPDSLYIMSGDTKLKSLALLDAFIESGIITEEGSYEGYVWLGADDQNVTLMGNDEEARVFGSESSSFADQVTTHSLAQSANAITVDSVGYYRFKLNLYTLELEVMGTEWGVIGSAIDPYDWSTSQVMDYDSETDLWSISTLTEAGEFKFRPNQTWDPLNYGDDGADLVPEEYGVNIVIGAGQHLITLDLGEFPYSYSVEAE